MREREEVVRKLRVERPKRIPWKSIALVLAASVVAGAVIVWVVRKQPAPQENVQFNHRAMFFYFGDGNNKPLENLTLMFPAPQIENRFAGRIFGGWELYYVEDDNSLTLQSTVAGIRNFREQRNSQLVIRASDVELGSHGPTLTWEVDRLYPREVFVDYGWTMVREEEADAVTLRKHGLEDWAFAYWHTPEAERENRLIDFSFAIGLYSGDALIERYEVSWENQSWGGFFLTRTV